MCGSFFDTLPEFQIEIPVVLILWQLASSEEMAAVELYSILFFRFPLPCLSLSHQEDLYHCSFTLVDVSLAAVISRLGSVCVFVQLL